MSDLAGGRAARLIERQMAMFQAQQRAAEELRQKAAEPVVAEEPEPAHYITISRQYGAGGSAVAAELAERLGWTLYDRQLLEAIAADARLQGQLLEPFDEHARGDMEHWIKSLLTDETVSEHHYTRSLFRVLRSLGEIGQAVIVGRGAHLVLPPENGLRVRIYAPLEARISRITEKEVLSRNEARKRIERMEDTRQGWLLRAYGDRAKEPMAFDLAVNPAALTTETCIAVVLTALEGKCHVAPPG